MSDEELKQLIASNAKALQALSSSLSELKEEWTKDRKQMYEWMSRLSVSICISG
jgi:hypothetical protein